MAKMQILFNGFEDLAHAVDLVGADLKEAVNEALEETQNIVRNNLIPAAAVYDAKGLKGYATGKMYGSIIKDTNVEWDGYVATVGVGFEARGGDTDAGFMHSIFVMYGTPRMSKDTRVYNAIKGTKTKKAIAAKQLEVMKKHYRLGGNND